MTARFPLPAGGGTWAANSGSPNKKGHMTEIQARRYVAVHSDDDDHDQEVLREVFAALAGRQPDERDEAEGLWSHCVALAS